MIADSRVLSNVSNFCKLTLKDLWVSVHLSMMSEDLVSPYEFKLNVSGMNSLTQ